MVAIIICGCSKISTSDELTETLNQNKDMEHEENTASCETFDVYRITNGNSEFDIAMKNNSIDVEYENEYLSEGVTTNDYISIQKKYLNVWKEEMYFSIDNFIRELSEQDKNAFFNSQQKWEDEINESIDFEHMILTNKEYVTEMGSAFDYLLLSEQRECYRQRTIRIKYLHYLLELSNNYNNNERKSLQFLYSSET